MVIDNTSSSKAIYDDQLLESCNQFYFRYPQQNRYESLSARPSTILLFYSFFKYDEDNVSAFFDFLLIYDRKDGHIYQIDRHHLSLNCIESILSFFIFSILLI